MRRGLTLIELIVSMVIVAFVFTIVPKMMIAVTKSSEQGKKEDAIFNAVSVLATISYLAWDENQTTLDESVSIITTDGEEDFNCTLENNRYRVGAFYTDETDNGRVCYSKVPASDIGYDEDSDEFGVDDVDDLNGSENEELFENLGYEASDYNIPDYNITAEICFVPDIDISNLTIWLDQNCINSEKKTNVKLIKVDVQRAENSSKRSLGSSIASFYYFAFNLGIAKDIPRKYIPE